MTRAKRVLFIAFGLAFLALGAIGIVIPGLPTTPFLLLAAALFLRGSERLYRWLVGHRVFGRYIYSYLRYRAIDARTKAGTIAVLSAGIGVSIAILDPLWARALLGFIGLAVTTHILLLRTLTEDLKARIDGEQASEASSEVE